MISPSSPNKCSEGTAQKLGACLPAVPHVLAVAQEKRLANRILQPKPTMPSRLSLLPFQQFLPALVMLLLACFLQACGKAEDPAKVEGSVSSISGYNYTIEGIQEFYVNGQWGGAISIGAGGNGDVCCLTLPKKWTPGLSATVTWRRSDCGGNGPGNDRCPFGTGGEGWHHKNLETVVPIEQYERAYTTYVVFLPKDEVKIYISQYAPDHPDHPAKLGKPRPLDHPEWRPYQP